MINPDNELTISRQCQLLGLSRSSFYSQNKAVSQQELDLMLAIDKIHLALPFYGARKIQVELNNRGFSMWGIWCLQSRGKMSEKKVSILAKCREVSSWISSSFTILLISM